jgi:ATPase subunit of ABC transporter with duplicated ATPase domains
MIQARNLTYSYGTKNIFDDVTFTVPSGYKVGLVGPNGAGKSTLFGLIMQKDQPDLGSIEVSGTIGYVPQEVKHDPILETVSTVKEYLDPTFLKTEYELTSMLQGLELEFLSLEHSPKELSGGQKTKLALARALIAEPDILLLDEPTNFMDTSGKRWVMNFLSTYPYTLIVISHDLDLLDQAIDKVLEIDPLYKKITESKGNLTKYLSLKEERKALQEKTLKKAVEKVERMQTGLSKLSGRTSAKGVRQRVIMQRRVERARDKLPTLPETAKTMKKIKFADPSPVGATPLKVEHISKQYGDKVIITDLSFYIERGERVALIGHNGSGKSTLIKTIMQMIEPDSGTVIKDERVKIGYYSQEFETFDMNESVWNTIKQSGHFTDGYIRSIFSSFLFDKDKLEQSVGTLSGGEKTRLAIALLLMQDFNLLILDEPTTYLDVTSQRIILEALKSYKGAMLIVSHTEDFIRELAPRRAIFMPSQKVDFWTDFFLTKVSEL